MRVGFRRENLGRAVVGFLAAMTGVVVVGTLVGMSLPEVLVFGVALGIGFSLGVLFFDQR
ncbi:hypothetical protein [Halomarina oriensis]|uniref:Uncharacterized protein n=1 Tax=Halomarina oriensis TaxID=671145 RepID=A0A6B0GPJ4_9EURY|nr:hypothetical protein [Halomarina oriensis]MWG36754.1 hypothetical protein [Halomarina oriensis]